MATDLLKKMGEETLYSAKGHFKSCDLRRQSVTATIWICAMLNVLSLAGFSHEMDRWLAIFSIFGLISLLIWNDGEGKNYRAKHKQAAENYLALHKEIRKCYYLNECTDLHISELSKRVIDFDKSDKPDIPGLARWWAKYSIEKGGETDNWFLND